MKLKNVLLPFLCIACSIGAQAQWTVTTTPDYKSTSDLSKFGFGGTPAYKIDAGNFTNGTLSKQVVLRIRNTVASNSYSGWGSAIEFYNNSNNIVSMAAHNEGGAKIISEASEYGWQHNLKFRVVKNNSYSSQTGIDALILASDGVASFPNKVGIGTDTPGSYKLAVNGKIWATELNVALTNPGPDYVFEKDYRLPSLQEVQSYIREHKHLPEIPSAKEMEADGVKVGEMNMLLLKKVEELTLYVIALEERMKEMEQEKK